MGEQKFTGVFDSNQFEIEDWFVEQLSEFTIRRRKQLLQDILPALDSCPSMMGGAKLRGV